MIKNIGFNESPPTKIQQHLNKGRGSIDLSVYNCIDVYTNTHALCITGEIENKEAFLLYPMSDFRGLYTTDWKTLTIIMATATVVVQGENLEEIATKLGESKGLAMRPVPKDDDVELGKGPIIYSIKIEQNR